MATAESVKAKLQGLINTANAATGNEDIDLTTAVNSLVAGFGQEGEAGVYMGTYTPADRVFDAVFFEAPGATRFAIQIIEPNLETGLAFFYSIVADSALTKVVCSNNAGTNPMGLSYATGAGNGNYYPVVELTGTGISVSAVVEHNYSKWFQAGATYDWIAW